MRLAQMGILIAVMSLLFYGFAFSTVDAEPPSPSFDAIIVPAGGQTPTGPPPHVMARIEQAAKLYLEAGTPKPKVITTAWGTPHKPCPHDAAGFEVHESSDNAKMLIKKGVAPSDILEESLSLETVGNAFYARVLHTDVLNLKTIAVINNKWHMPRTKAVFGHVFSVPAKPGLPSPRYSLEFFAVDHHLPEPILSARLEKETKATPKFSVGSDWQRRTSSMQSLHTWVHQENTAYAVKRLLVDRKPLDPELLKSY
jgi:uncharacterized SAM-binding protein YcdF (DUF218 family)